MMKKMLTVAALSISLVGVLFPASGTAAAEPFTDIAGHWAKTNIETAVKAGYVSGYPDGTFKPDSNVSRAEFLAIVTRASELSDAGAVEPFEDVATTHWAADAINRGIGMGFINPADFGSSFAPDKALTRAEMVKWLVSGLAKADTSFVEALRDTKETILPFTEYFPGKFKESDIPYIAVSRGTGLVGGFPDGSFGPDRTTTRAEVVVLLERYLGVEGTKADAYKPLNELREVGLYGTNVKTVGKAEWVYDFEMNKVPFYNAIGKELITELPYGTLVLEKYIMVDKELTSVYADMFLSENQQKDLKNSRFHAQFTLLTLTPNRDLSDQSYLNMLPSITGYTFQAREGVVQKYGYEALVSGGKFSWRFKEGTTSTFWTYDSLPLSALIRLQTLDKKHHGFYLGSRS